MNIDSYPNLIDAIKSWLNRDDQTTVDNIPTFIRIAEVEIFRMLKLREYESLVKLPVVDGRIEIPEDLNELIEIYTDNNTTGRATSHRELLRHKLSGEFHDQFYFAQVGNYYFVHEESNIKEVWVRYYYKNDYLSYQKPVTKLLKIAPDLILWTALKHGSTFSEDIEKVGVWDNYADNAMQELFKQKKDDEMSGSPLVVEKNEDTMLHGGRIRTYW